MKTRLVVFALLGLMAAQVFAHRLDEYLQATIFAIGPGSIQGAMRLVPGVAVAPAVIAIIDTNRDGVLSNQEQRRYAEAVLKDLKLQEDGKELPLHLVSAGFPTVDQMAQGTGEIELTFSAELSGVRGEHQLRFENHHQSGRSVYLVNSLVPQDKGLLLGAQDRSGNQSIYKVTLTEDSGTSFHEFTWSGFGEAFRLGIRHIAGGVDHLLFLLTLLLPAPLLASGGRWSGRARIRPSLTYILRIVTAFTLGHSLTLALSGMGWVHLPSQLVEVLIAVSILVSAVHALRPLFPGREATIAALFGLIHGLAFASALNELGVAGWYRLVSLLGFNLGIEAMQLAVVAMTLPPLLVLSRTKRYATVRITGGALACMAACVWITERMLNQPNSIGYGIETVAHHGVLLCAGLWVYSAVAGLRG